MNVSIHRFSISSAALLLLSSAALAQGLLTPPSGAPAPVMKTLDQIEPRTPISALPFTISTPGSYYVTGNLTGVSGQHGITISATNVTLDLGGFRIAGAAGAAAHGILMSLGGVLNNVTVRNGTVRNWTGDGVLSGSPFYEVIRVENVLVLDCGGSGIVLGSGSVAINCVARGNGAAGISGPHRCRVSGCSSHDNFGTGISLETDAVVNECTATNNGGGGIRVALTGGTLRACIASNNTGHGFDVASGGTLRDCFALTNTSAGFNSPGAITASGCISQGNGLEGFNFSSLCSLSHCVAENNSRGIVAGEGANLQDCVADRNRGVGISTSHHATVAGCTVRNNTGDSGLNVGDGSHVRGCTVSTNTGSGATSEGIRAGIGSSVVQCVSMGNLTSAAPTASTGMGIVVGTSSHVRECTVTGNQGDGIRAGGSCMIIGNQCTSNRSGIHSTGTSSRIEDNRVGSSTLIGLDVDGANNTIVRNTAVANATNYDLVAGNSVGAIVLPAASAAINTNVALPGSLGTTDPWANTSD